MTSKHLAGPTLDEIALRCGTDKSSRGHNYCPWYEQFFGHLRHYPVRLLEIGVKEGASIRMWLEYFDHPEAHVSGIDVEQCWTAKSPRYTFYQTDVKAFVPPYPLHNNVDPLYDIVVDDGSHFGPDVRAAFDILWPVLVPGGWYVIEDLAWGWLDAGGRPLVTETKELLVSLLDCMDKDWHGNSCGRQATCGIAPPLAPRAHGRWWARAHGRWWARAQPASVPRPCSAPASTVKAVAGVQVLGEIAFIRKAPDDTYVVPDAYVPTMEEFTDAHDKGVEAWA